MPTGVYVRTEENTKNIRIAQRKRLTGKTLEQIYGKATAKEMKRKIQQANSKPYEKRYGKTKAEEMKGMIKLQQTGENNNIWKGDDAQINTKHGWLSKKYGKANHCINPTCSRKSKTFDIAKKNHNTPYTRNINEYQQLCRTCHIGYDKGKIRINGRYGY